jgi:hypothetical protein
MSHIRQDTLTRPPEWWKHLKWLKKFVSKRERKAAKKQIQLDVLQDKWEDITNSMKPKIWM